LLNFKKLKIKRDINIRRYRILKNRIAKGVSFSCKYFSVYNPKYSKYIHDHLKNNIGDTINI